MFVKQEHFERAKRNRDKEPWSTFYKALMKSADEFLETQLPRVDRSRHNWILEQARDLIRYSLVLAGAYRLTGEEKYADRCWYFILDMLEWDCWYWENSCSGTYKYDLTTGEIAYAFSMLFHLMEDWFGDSRMQKMLKVIYIRIIDTYLSATDSDNHSGKTVVWYNWTNNWNAVCNGGMLCLALYLKDRYEDAKKAVSIALRGLNYYIDALHEDGSSPEGIVYWSYGLSYMTYALLSYESSMGQKHPVFSRKVLKDGLSFPFDFSPDGTGISFGDVNSFFPNPVLYILAEQAGKKELITEVTRRNLERSQESPLYALLFCSDSYKYESGKKVEEEEKVRKWMKVYPDNGWGLFTSGCITMSFRAGSSNAPHTHKDLNSIQLVKNKALLLENIGNHPYTLGWFGEGRDLYAENNTVSKNSMLVNGGGQLKLADAEWGYDEVSMWSDAACAYPVYVKKMFRKISLEQNMIMMRDEFETTRMAWHEIRFLTYGSFEELQPGKWRVVKNGAEVILCFEAGCELYYSPCEMPHSIGIRPSARMLRVITKEPLSASYICTSFLSTM